MTSDLGLQDAQASGRMSRFFISANVTSGSQLETFGGCKAGSLPRSMGSRGNCNRARSPRLHRVRRFAPSARSLSSLLLTQLPWALGRAPRPVSSRGGVRRSPYVERADFGSLRLDQPRAGRRAEAGPRLLVALHRQRGRRQPDRAHPPRPLAGGGEGWRARSRRLKACIWVRRRESRSSRSRSRVNRTCGACSASPYGPATSRGGEEWPSRCVISRANAKPFWSSHQRRHPAEEPR